MPPRISFVGFGEVASAFSKALRENGAEVAVYDVNLTRPGGRTLLEQRAKAPGIRFLPLGEALKGAELVLSTVRPQTAREAARDCAAHLKPGQCYVDFNSVSPAEKLQIASLVVPTGAEFVEGAILGAVGATGAATAALTGGSKGEAVARTLTGLGLRVSPLDGEPGRVALFKMLRSSFSKGLEAVLLETLTAARKAGLEKELWRELVDLLTKTPFDRVASNWIQTHPCACGRRHHEMTEVVDVLRGLGADPLMAPATEAFFRRSAAREFPKSRPSSVSEALDLLIGERA
ncbi:MAG: NAD(P)-dependent oxidoreductase [Planctomycetes bacterium]|nr:NAD(P)-dependent oxidoreductase [Planctomycetota bacterium]